MLADGKRELKAHLKSPRSRNVSLKETSGGLYDLFGNRKDGKSERDVAWGGSKRTWTLVALRAATEPAKEDAMQAMLKIVFVCVSVGVCVQEWRLGERLRPIYTPFFGGGVNL
jgi:hypothetical protein